MYTCTKCSVRKLRALTSLPWCWVAGEGVGWLGGGVMNERAWRIPGRGQRGRASQLYALESDCRGARCLTVRRCLRTPIPDARGEESHKHRQERREGRNSKRRRDLKKNKYIHILDFFFKPARSVCWICASEEELPGTWSTGYQLKKYNPLSVCGAAACARPIITLEYTASLYAQTNGNDLTWIYFCNKTGHLQKRLTFFFSFWLQLLPLLYLLLFFRLTYGYFIISCP